MKMIAGRIKPDAGTITVGATIKIGYYTQEIETGREAGIAYMEMCIRDRYRGIHGKNTGGGRGIFKENL